MEGVTVSQDDAIKMVEAVCLLHDEIAQGLQSHALTPTAGSPADLELRSYKRPESIRTALSQGSVLIEVTADQLMAFTKTVNEPVQTIAPWTCVRSLLESGALACWLLDPGIKAQDRVKRSLSFRYEGLSQQLKYARSLTANDEFNRINCRIDELEAVATGLGFPRVNNGKGKRIGVGQVMPTVTMLVTNMLSEEANYRLLSSIAHAHPWALLQTSFRREPHEGDGVVIDDGANGWGAILGKAIAPRAIACLCGLAGKCLLRPMKYKGILYGWSQSLVSSIEDAALLACPSLPARILKALWRG